MSKQISDDIKQFSYEICQKHKVIIRYMETDKEHTFWTDGYFVCSVGNVSEKMPRKYIENQG
jgi:putative transposase